MAWLDVEAALQWIIIFLIIICLIIILSSARTHIPYGINPYSCAITQVRLSIDWPVWDGAQMPS